MYKKQINHINIDIIKILFLKLKIDGLITVIGDINYSNLVRDSPFNRNLVIFRRDDINTRFSENSSSLYYL